jgi:hypothetical protein
MSDSLPVADEAASTLDEIVTEPVQVAPVAAPVADPGTSAAQCLSDLDQFVTDFAAVANVSEFDARNVAAHVRKITARLSTYS